MRLPVLASTEDPAPPAVEPWYAGGLKFTCTQCGNCCTGGPGFVWLSKIEIGRLAEFLKLTPAKVLQKYCRKVDGRISLKERVSPAGLYDCVFLTEEKSTRRTRLSDGTDAEVVFTKRGCSIYPVRPLQCRTWPFWPEIMRTPENWNHAAKRCPGMNAGSRHFDLQKMESLRDATDWPQNPPTSIRGSDEGGGSDEATERRSDEGIG